MSSDTHPKPPDPPRAVTRFDEVLTIGYFPRPTACCGANVAPYAADYYETGTVICRCESCKRVETPDGMVEDEYSIAYSAALTNGLRAAFEHTYNPDGHPLRRCP